MSIYTEEEINYWREGRKKFDLINFFYNATHPKPYCSSPPHQIYIEPTNACNLKCKHCPQHTMRRKKQTMDIKLFKKIIKDISQYSPFVDLYLQGEGLLHNKIVDMVRICKENGLKPRCTTNCYPLTRDKSKKLIEAGLDKIEFSMSGASKKTYDKIYIGGKYEKALTNMLNFLEENAAAGFPVHTRSVFVEEEATIDEKDKYIDMFSKLPLDSVYISPLINMFGWNEEMSLDEFHKIPKKDWPICKGPWRQLGINADGTVRSCIFDYDSRYIIGDATKENVMDIWNNSRMQAFRSMLIEKRYGDLEEPGLPLCTECSQIWPVSDQSATTQLPVNFLKEMKDFFGNEHTSFTVQYEDKKIKEKKMEYLKQNREKWFSQILADCNEKEE